MALRSILWCSILFSVTIALGQSGWEQVPTPNPGPDLNILRDISGTDLSNLWTVGNFSVNTADISPLVIHNLVLQWNGNGWTEHDVQNFSALYNVLWGVHAFADDDVWAVGDYNAGGGMARPQIHHWDGSDWTSTAVVPIGGGAAFVHAMDATAPDDIWLAGGKAEVGVDVPYVLHYDGSDWTELNAPPVASNINWFYDISALAPDDVWAVGFHRGLPPNVDRFLIMHWDGSQWQQAPLSSEAMNITGRLRSIKMISPNEGWASTSFSDVGPVLLRWDGTSWNVEQTGTPSRRAFAPIAPDDIYAFGSTITHWDGSNWSEADALADHPYPALTSSTVLEDGSVWAAGSEAETDGDTWTLVYRSDGDISTAITSRSGADRVHAYPDPFMDRITLRFGQLDQNVREVHCTGVATGITVTIGDWSSPGNGAIELDLSRYEIAPGAYVITIVTSVGVQKVKVIKI